MGIIDKCGTLWERAGRAAASAADRLGAVKAIVRLIDNVDERAARRLRRALGRRAWLVSWQPGRNGRWQARISAPELVRTIERTGWTRWQAIRRATAAVDRLPTLRARIGRHPRHVAGVMTGDDPD